LRPLDFEIMSKKSFFSISRGKKQISPLLAPPWKKFWENPLLPPQQKILPTIKAHSGISMGDVFSQNKKAS